MSSLRQMRRRMTITGIFNEDKDKPKNASTDNSAPNPFGNNYDPYTSGNVAPSASEETGEKKRSQSFRSVESPLKGHHAKSASLTSNNPKEEEQVISPKGSNTPQAPSHVDKGIFLQVKFTPDLAPFEFKVFNLDKNCTVSQAILVIQNSYKLQYKQSIGLYSIEGKCWLEDREKLSTFHPVWLESLEYRDRNHKVDMGSLRDRRKSQSLSRGSTSKYFKNFIDAFQTTVKKKEDEQKREAELYSSMTEKELAETKSKLSKLGLPQTREKLTRERRSMSVGENMDKNMKFQAMEHMLEQKDADAKLAAEIGQALLIKNGELLQEIERLRAKEKEHYELMQKYAELEGDFIRMSSRCMVLESQISEAAQSYELLLQEVGLKDEKLERYSHKLKDINMNANEDKERMIQRQNEDLEKLRQDIAKLQENERMVKRKLKKAVEDKMKLTDDIANMSEKLTSKDEVEELKKKLKHLSETNDSLNKKVKKIASNQASIEGTTLTTETMYTMLMTSLTKNKIIDLSKDEDKVLLTNVSNLVNSLYEEKDTSIFRKIMEKVEKKMQMEANVEDADSSSDDLHVNIGYFMLSMLLLGRVDFLEKKLAGELKTEETLSEDIQELQEKLEYEIRAKHKLEEKLELSSRNNELLLEEQLTLFKSEYQKTFDELLQKKQKEVEFVIEEEERIKSECDEQVRELQNQLDALQLENSKIEEYERQLKEKDAKIAELNTLKTQLFAAAKNGQEKNKALEKLIEDLKADIEDLQVDLDKSLNDLAEEKKRNESLSSTSTEAHAKIAEDLKQEREKVAKATEDIKVLENSLQSEKNKNNELQGKIDSLQGEISAKILLHDQIQASYDSKHKEHEEFKQNSKKELEQAEIAFNAKLAEQKTLYEQQHQSSLQHITSLKEEYQKLQGIFDETKIQLESLQGDLHKERENGNNLREEISKHQKSADQLRNELNEEKARYDVLAKESENVKQKLEQEKTLVQELQKSSSSDSEKYKQLQTQLENLQGDLHKERENGNNLREEISKHQKTAEQLRNELNEEKARYDVLAKESENVKQKLEQEKTLVQELQKSSSSDSERYKQLETQLESQLKETEEMKQRIEQLNKDANNSKSHIDELNRQASDTQAQITSLLSEKEGFKLQVETLTSQLKESNDSKDSLSKQLESLNDINSSQKKKIEELENLVAQLQLENNRLKKELEDIKSTPLPEPPKPQTVLVGTAGGWQSPLPQEVLIALQEYVLTSEERKYIDYLNKVYKDDHKLGHHFPISYMGTEVITALMDGSVLCSLINKAVPNTIDERVIKLVPKNEDQVIGNHNLYANSALGIGVNSNNIVGYTDLQGGKIGRLITFIGDIIEIIFLSKVSPQYHPELQALIQGKEEPSDLWNLLPEELLLRWFNFHLSLGKFKTISNFTTDLKDGTAYLQLLSQIAPTTTSSAEDSITKIVEIAGKLKCDDLLLAEDIVQGTPRFNVLFIAQLFDKYTNLAVAMQLKAGNTPSTQFATPVKSANHTFEDIGTREERAFRFWINSLKIPIRNLYEDMKDGIVLLKVFDVIQKGSVDWKKVSMTPNNPYKKLENCSYVVVVATNQLAFQITNIGGKDIFEGNKKLILAIIWQAMRLNIFSILNQLSFDDNEVTENGMIEWSNKKVAESGRNSSMQSFKDPTLKDAKFLIDLINAIKPGSVDYDLVTPGNTEEELKLNAQYAISVARQIGCCIFLLWEDIVEVNHKMILTFVGSLIVLATSKDPKKSSNTNRGSLRRKTSLMNIKQSFRDLQQQQQQ